MNMALALANSNLHGSVRCDPTPPTLPPSFVNTSLPVVTRKYSKSLFGNTCEREYFRTKGMEVYFEHFFFFFLSTASHCEMEGVCFLQVTVLRWIYCFLLLTCDREAFGSHDSWTC